MYNQNKQYWYVYRNQGKIILHQAALQVRDLVVVQVAFAAAVVAAAAAAAAAVQTAIVEDDQKNQFL